MTSGLSTSTDEFVARVRARKLAAQRRRRRLLWGACAGLMIVAVVVAGVVVGIGMGGARSAAPAAGTPADVRDEPSATPTARPQVPSEPSRGAQPAPPTALDPAVRQALKSLDTIADVSGQSITRYYREAYGQAWADVDRNGCDTRNDILRRDLGDLVIKPGTNGCKVLGGTLVDLYTGATVPFVSGWETSRLVQIDHVVPLAWSWRHGAESWTPEQLTAFANDPANLQATTEDANQTKSDSGPSEWLPPDPAAQCTYAERFIAVLDAWDLGLNAADRSALAGILATCR